MRIIQDIRSALMPIALQLCIMLRIHIKFNYTTCSCCIHAARSLYTSRVSYHSTRNILGFNHALNQKQKHFGFNHALNQKQKHHKKSAENKTTGGTGAHLCELACKGFSLPAELRNLRVGYGSELCLQPLLHLRDPLRDVFRFLCLVSVLFPKAQSVGCVVTLFK